MYLDLSYLKNIYFNISIIVFSKCCLDPSLQLVLKWFGTDMGLGDNYVTECNGS